MKRVMCFGTFDILHPGHVAFLTTARKLGTELYVVVARDARRQALSGGILPVHSEKERVLMLNALKPVTKALVGHKTDMLHHIKRLKPEIIVLGHDQTFGIDKLNEWVGKQRKKPRIVRLKAFNRARNSTTRIKTDLCNNKPQLAA